MKRQIVKIPITKNRMPVRITDTPTMIVLEVLMPIRASL